MSKTMTDVVQSKYGAVAQSDLSNDNPGVHGRRRGFRLFGR
jgi:hypothetical protein